MRRLLSEVKMAALLGLVSIAGCGAWAAENSEPILFSGRHRPEWSMQGVAPHPSHERWTHHFLLEEGPSRDDALPDGWPEKVAQRDADLAVGWLEGTDASEWRRKFLEAATWRYPRGGDLATALVYFRCKAGWVHRAFQNPAWMHNPEILEAAAGVLEEIAEWSFPVDELWFESRPGQEALRAAGVQSPDDLSDDASRESYREAVSADARRHDLAKLQECLFSERRVLAQKTWWHCMQALSEAEQSGDTTAQRRLDHVKTRIVGSVEPAERDRLIHNVEASIPDKPVFLPPNPPPTQNPTRADGGECLP